MINNTLYKVMWAAEGNNIIWDMKQEVRDDACESIRLLLGNHIDVAAWCADYERHYRSWLNEDDTAIYDIRSAINQAMIQAVVAFNKQEKFGLYYWFDTDRTNDEAFHWQTSPLSGDRLVELNSKFPPRIATWPKMIFSFFQNNTSHAPTPLR